MNYIYVGIITLLAGAVQTVTGFGASIVNMLMFTSIFSLSIAPSVNDLINIPLSVGISLTYRKHISYKLLFIPAIFFMISSTMAINYVKGADLNSLKVIFGIFLSLLGIYNLFYSEKIKIKGSLLSAIICSFLSGIMGGLFGIGGPLMVVYYLAVTSGKEEYLGTINCFFLLTGIYRALLRISNGLFTIDLTGFVMVGIVGILAGKFTGQKIVDKVDGKTFKRIIYVFLIIAGVINVINAL